MKLQKKTKYAPVQRLLILFFPAGHRGGGAKIWGLANLPEKLPFTSLLRLRWKNKGDQKKKYISLKLSSPSLCRARLIQWELLAILRALLWSKSNSWHLGLKTKLNPPDDLQYLTNWSKLKRAKCCTNNSTYRNSDLVTSVTWIHQSFKHSDDCQSDLEFAFKDRPSNQNYYFVVTFELQNTWSYCHLLSSGIDNRN